MIDDQRLLEAALAAGVAGMASGCAALFLILGLPVWLVVGLLVMSAAAGIWLFVTVYRSVWPPEVEYQ